MDDALPKLKVLICRGRKDVTIKVSNTAALHLSISCTVTL